MIKIRKKTNFEHSDVTTHRHLLGLKTEIEFRYKFAGAQKRSWKMDHLEHLQMIKQHYAISFHCLDLYTF